MACLPWTFSAISTGTNYVPEQVRREGIAAKWRLAAIEGID